MAKTKEELISMIENDLVDSTSQKITGASVKNIMLEMVETMAESAGSGGGGSSTMEYWGVPAGYELDALGELCGLCVLGKFSLDGQTLIVSAGFAGVLPADTAVAFAFDPNIKMAYPGMGLATAKEILAQMGVNDLSAAGLTPITEEEFYAM